MWLKPECITSLKEAGPGNRYYNIAGAGIYYNTYPVKHADPETFVFLYGFAKDKDRCYRMGEAFRGADAASFEVLNRYFARDKKHIYNREGIDKKVDYATFEVLDTGERTGGDGRAHDATSYAKDKNGLWMMTYYQYKPLAVKGVDTATFERINASFAKDVKYVIWQGKKVKKADPGSFQAWNENYGRDANHVICQDNLLTAADYASFETVPHNITIARDRSSYFQFDRSITEEDYTALIKDNIGDK